MIIITIQGTEYKLPTNVRELSIAKGVEIDLLKEKYPEPNIKYKCRVLSLLLDAPLELIRQCDEGQINVIIDHLPYIRDDIKTYFSHSFTLLGKDYSLIDLSALTVEEYTDIDSYLEQSIHQNISNILSVLYRPVIKEKMDIISITRRMVSRWYTQAIAKDYQNEKVIPLSEDEHKERAQLFESYLNWGGARAMVLSYLSFKEDLLREFKLIDEPNQDEESDIEEPEVQRRGKNSLSELWGLYHVLEVVSNGNVIEQEKWLKKPIRHLLTKLYYLRQKSVIEK
jgi:hypothetical protein